MKDYSQGTKQEGYIQLILCLNTGTSETIQRDFSGTNALSGIASIYMQWDQCQLRYHSCRGRIIFFLDVFLHTATVVEMSSEASTSAQPIKQDFTSLSSLLDSRLLRAIASLGFTHPTAVQSKVIPLALQGKDILARARTGSGKTLAYGIPALQTILKAKTSLENTDLGFHATRSLILVPTRELAEQVYGHLKTLAEALGEDLVQVCNVAGGGEQSNKKKAKTSGIGGSSSRDKVQRMQLADKPAIIVATPARALTHLRSKALDISKLECLIIDEADLILSYGHSSDDIKSILSGPWDLPTSYHSFLMSATMTGEVEELQGMVLRDPEILILDDAEDQYANLTQYAVR